MSELGHFHPKGKMPSQYTIAAQAKQREILPFEDTQDFQEAKQGFIAAPPYRKIMTAKGGVAWDMDNWAFLLRGQAFEGRYGENCVKARQTSEISEISEVFWEFTQQSGFNLSRSCPAPKRASRPNPKKNC